MQWGRVRKVHHGQAAAEVWNLEVEEDNSYVADGIAVHNCQEYSYMAMPWTRAKAKAAAIRVDTSGKMLADLNRLFDACFRIQEQASLAAGRHIPLVVENVRGAQPWVGRARWNFGSFYLWGDVPALMPFTRYGTLMKFGKVCHSHKDWRQVQSGADIPHPHKTTRHLTNPAEHEGRKVGGGADGWFEGNLEHPLRQHHSAHPKRKEASAMIAKIPLPLARYIGRFFRAGANP